MKKLAYFFGICLAVFLTGLVFISVAEAAPNVLQISGGGTGWANWVSGTIPIGNGVAPLATSSAFTFSTSSNRLSVTYASSTMVDFTTASTTNFFGAMLRTCNSGNVLTWSAGTFGCAADQTTAGAPPFSWGTNNFATATAATTTSIWSIGAFFSSSTALASQFPYASTTAISATNGIFTNLSNLTTNGFVKTSGGNGALSIDNGTYVLAAISVNTTAPLTGGGDLSTSRTITCPTCGTFAYNQLNPFATSTFSSSTSMWTQGVFFSSSTAAASQFPYATSTMHSMTTASTTNLTVDILTNALALGNSIGSIGKYAGFSNPCTNQVFTTMSPAGAGGGCVSINNAWWSGTQLAIANGGTNATSFTTNGNGVYWNNTALVTAPLTSAVTYPYASTTAISATNASSTKLFIDAYLKVGGDTKQTFEVLRFSYSSSTQGSGTTTKFLGVAESAMTFDSAQCDSNRWLGVALQGSPGFADFLIASNTIGTFNYTTNNTYTAGQVIRVDIGTTTNVGTNANTATSSLGCTLKFRHTN